MIASIYLRASSESISEAGKELGLEELELEQFYCAVMSIVYEAEFVLDINLEQESAKIVSVNGQKVQ